MDKRDYKRDYRRNNGPRGQNQGLVFEQWAVGMNTVSSRNRLFNIHGMVMSQADALKSSPGQWHSPHLANMGLPNKRSGK